MTPLDDCWSPDPTMSTVEDLNNPSLTPAEQPGEPGASKYRLWRISQLEDFIDTHHRLPDPAAGTRTERSLGRWACAQFRLPDPHPRLLAALQPYGGYSVVPTAAQMLERYQQYCQTYGHRPSNSRSDPETAKLGGWAYKQVRSGSPVEGLAELMAAYPTAAAHAARERQEQRAAEAVAKAPWSTSDYTLGRIDQLQRFTQSHGRLPARRTGDTEERKLAEWAYKHTRLQHPHPDVMAIITTFGGYGEHTVNATTRTRLEQLQAFVEATGHLPRYRSQNRWEAELGQWLTAHLKVKSPNPQVLAVVEAAGGYPRGKRPQERSARRLEQLQEFVDTRGRLPQERSEDVGEAELGRWAAQVHRRGKPAAAAELINRSGGYPRTGRKRRSVELAARLSAFVQAHGRLPDPHQHGTEEAVLGRWALNQVRVVKHPDPQVIALIERHGGYPRAGNDRRCEARASDLASFLQTHGRLPSPRAADQEEASLGRWARHVQRRGTPDTVVEMITTAGGYSLARRSIITDERVQELEVFVATHGRLPRPTISAGEESRLGSWLHKHLRTKVPNPKVKAIVDRTPKVPAIRRSKIAEQRTAELASFVAAHGRLPRTTSDDDAEQLLGRWAYTHLKSQAPHPPAVKLIEQAGGYGNSLQALTDRRVAELRLFVESHGRLPRKNTGTAQEKSLGSWIYTHYRSAQRDPRVMAITEQTGGFRAPNREISARRVAQLESFVAEHGRLPQPRSDETEERQLGSWALEHLKYHNAHPRAVELIRQHGGYSTWHKSTAERRINELETFLSAHGRLPRKHTGDEQERSLGRWVYTHRRSQNPSPRAVELIDGAGGYRRLK